MSWKKTRSRQRSSTCRRFPNNRDYLCRCDEQWRGAILTGSETRGARSETVRSGPSRESDLSPEEHLGFGDDNIVKTDLDAPLLE
jgi:hypothetical protein